MAGRAAGADIEPRAAAADGVPALGEVDPVARAVAGAARRDAVSRVGRGVAAGADFAAEGAGAARRASLVDRAAAEPRPSALTHPVRRTRTHAPLRSTSRSTIPPSAVATAAPSGVARSVALPCTATRPPLPAGVTVRAGIHPSSVTSRQAPFVAPGVTGAPRDRVATRAPSGAARNSACAVETRTWEPPWASAAAGEAARAAKTSSCRGEMRTRTSGVADHPGVS